VFGGGEEGSAAASDIFPGGLGCAAVLGVGIWEFWLVEGGSNSCFVCFLPPCYAVAS